MLTALDNELTAEKAIHFFFFGKPAFIFEYAFADTVDFDLGREVPAALRAFMFA